jgi:hypothetical protein
VALRYSAKKTNPIFGMQTKTPAPDDHPFEWRLTISSWLLYALAFNLVFFLQELFLVLPKALTPGLYPTLFHNNQTWTGQDPLQDLLQGTGAVSIFLIGTIFAFLLHSRPERSTTHHLFIFWMAYQGLFQSLPQVVIGGMNPSNDVGMAMNYLGLGRADKAVAGFVALGVMAAAGLWLGPHLLSLAPDSAQIHTRSKRAGFIFRIGVLPAFAGIILIVPFRMPRNLVELILWPLIVTFAGTLWLQLSARRITRVRYCGRPKPASIFLPFWALVILVLIFQLILRPGIRFYY